MPPSATRRQRRPLNPRGAGALQEPRLRVRQAPSKGASGLTARNLAVGPQIARYTLVRTYSAQLGFRIGAHALRAAAVTDALDNQADVAKSRSGSATPTSPPPASTTTENPARGQPDIVILKILAVSFERRVTRHTSLLTWPDAVRFPIEQSSRPVWRPRVGICRTFCWWPLIDRLADTTPQAGSAFGSAFPGEAT